MSIVVTGGANAFLDVRGGDNDDELDLASFHPEICAEHLRRESQRGELHQVLHILMRVAQSGQQKINLKLEHATTIEELERRGMLVENKVDHCTVSWYPKADIRPS